MDNKNPDYEIEQYWLLLKDSMINFYKQTQCNSRPIRDWSNYLNLLQKEKLYTEIEMNIRNYISLFAIDVLRNVNLYHLDILKTNIKRWNKLSCNYDFSKIIGKKYYNIIFLLIDIFNNLEKKIPINLFTKIYTEIELILIYEDFTHLVDLAIEYNIPTVLDKIWSFTNINSHLIKKYKVDKNILKNKYSGAKLIKLLKSDNM
jgi:hypothetical protein